MATIDILKEQEAALTPVFLFDCTFKNGTVERWSTHEVSYGGNTYNARLLKHNLFELRAAADDGLDGTAKISVTLANADSRYSQLEREVGFKGAQLTIRFLFFDLVAATTSDDVRTVFRGVGNTADEITQSDFRVTFSNRFNLQRVVLPDIRIERRCPWSFPATSDQRQEALTGGQKGIYSPFYRCGYSPDQTGGVGTLNGSAAYTSCDYSRANCEARGMFDKDSSGNVTRRFGGMEFVPPQILVRSFGESGTHASPVLDNLALYNDYVPLLYGTTWSQPPVPFLRNDGNLTRMEVLLGAGEVDGIITVLVNDIEIPQSVAGADMTATGWYTLVTPGTRVGAFNLNFTDGAGNPLGDPYGSMAMLSIVVPNRINAGQSLPTVKVLARGLKLEQFDSTGASLGTSFTNNPAWVVLDILRRTGWTTSDVDLVSFATAGAYCADPLTTTDVYGNPASIHRFECNLAISSKKSAGEILRGMKSASSLILTYNSSGLLTLRVENTLALQQPTKPAGSNSTDALNGGWPVYEFSDGSAGFSGILRKPNGTPSIRVFSKSGADVPNRLSVEFQDEFNDYQQDSLSLTDIDDQILTGREVSATSTAIGLTNFDQATRALQLQLAKSIQGNTFVEFETTVRGVDLSPGDVIALTYVKEGFERQPFRVTKLAPGRNYESVLITAQWHDDGWYAPGAAGTAPGTRGYGAEGSLPRPLVGSLIDSNGVEQFGVTESLVPTGDGSGILTLSVAFTVPPAVTTSTAQVPIVGLNPVIATTGGTLAGGQTLYYALTAVDAGGGETALSFAIPALLRSSTNTNAVTLGGFSFSSGTTGFSVYRGMNPFQLLRIAHNVPPASTFTDSGATADLVGPPDANYNHANFYWRLEQQPDTAADIHTATTIGQSTLGMLANEFQGAVVRILSGTGVHQERSIVSNDATTLTVTPPWTVVPDSTSHFAISDGTWRFGGMSATSPAEFQVPDRPGTTVQISGQSANDQDQESPADLNPFTRYQLIGGSGGVADSDVPPAPIFALNAPGRGTVELLGIGFSSFTNTHTITAGTLNVYYWPELSSPTTFSITAAIAATDTTITLNAAGSGTAGTLLQIEDEVLEITQVLGGGAQYVVTRGSHGTTAASHAAGVALYHLSRTIFIAPFVKGFFGSPASGSFSQSFALANARLGAADLFLTNSFGNGADAQAQFTSLTDGGLRTLSGGQMSIQVDGYLAVQTSAAPPLVVEDGHAARDIFAVVNGAPSGGAVVLNLRVNTTVYATLTIPDGGIVSNTVSGFGLKSFAPGDKIFLDVVSVPTSSGSLPGRDLTVTIRL